MSDFHTLRVKALRDETPDTRSFVLEPTDGLPLRYRAGQFLTLLLNLTGTEIRRSYSLSSAPGIDPDPTLTIKRVPNGAASRYLLDHLRVGDELRALKPAGRFTLDPSDGTPRDLVFFAAGSGITPVFALLKTTLYTEPTACCTLIFSNRSPRSTIYRSELDQLAEQFPDRFALQHWWSQPPDGFPKRLNNAAVERLVGEVLRYPPERAEWYLCGPEDYMRMIRIVLLFLGINPERIHREAFVVEAPDAPPPIRDLDAPPCQVQIRYRNRVYDLTVPPGQYILTAALKDGIALPYSCRGGRCSACTARCTSGRVKMTINDVLTDRDLREGYVLTCTGIPETDEVVLEINE
jgi:ring-1,2-phenylacetyl-CoA epoxidase subunit PaaE